MGFSTLIDIVGASIIGGMMLLSLKTLVSSSQEKSSNYQSNLIAQENLTSIIELMEHDFSRIGYCENPDSIMDPKDMIISADSSSITFWTDVAQSATNFRGDGTRDYLTYELGNLVPGTPNPNDRVLYRYVNGKNKVGSNLGVTEFSIHYFDNMGNELPYPINLNLISYLQIDIRVEDSYGYDTGNAEKSDLDKYPTIFWRQIRLASKNLSR